MHGLLVTSPSQCSVRHGESLEVLIFRLRKGLALPVSTTDIKRTRILRLCVAVLRSNHYAVYG